MRREQLFTFQAAGQDITAYRPPLSDYTEEGGAYFDLAAFLGWRSWVWGLVDPWGFLNDYMAPAWTEALVLWVLSVPASRVRWCGLRAQCENVMPVRAWFYPNPEACRAAGDIPQGLVKSPVDPAWVVDVRPCSVSPIEGCRGPAATVGHGRPWREP